MEMLSKYLSHITSSLYSCILLWKAKPSKNDRAGEAGLKTLVHSKEKPPPRIVHRYESKPSSPQPWPLPSLWSPSSPATTMIGDVIGSESGDCMITDMEEVRAEPEPPKARGRGMRDRKREFPPPITLLRETGRMSWTFKREYSGDGRLVITAEIVRRHELCFEARREDRRLTMRFVHEDGTGGYAVDDDVEDFEFNEGFECDVDEEENGFESEEELANESERHGHGDLRECASVNVNVSVSVTYDAGGPAGLLQLHHSDSFPNTLLGRPVSASLRPMTPVM